MAKKFQRQIQQANKFFSEDIWHMGQFAGIARWKIWLIIQLRVVLVAIKGITADKCVQKASALTYYSLLSVVPVFAMFFGIAKGFGYADNLEQMLYEKLGDKKEILDQILEFSQNFLDNTKGGIIAGAGIVVLFWSVLKVMNNIEEAFNEIWHVKRQRSLIRKLSDYLTIFILAPVILIISNGATAFISEHVSGLAQEIPFYENFGGIVTFLLQLLPLSLVWIVLAVLYMVMPNTKVKFSSALIAGVIAGIAFQLVQFLYIKFQVGMARYNAIYGSFAALPLFLIWLQTSWLIVLVGAEIAYANQNHREFELKKGIDELNHRLRTDVSVLVAQCIAKNFQSGGDPLTLSKISKKLKVPMRIVNSVLYDLTVAGVLCETAADEDKSNGYLPAFDIHTMTITSVVDKLENHGDYELEMDHISVYTALSENRKAMYEMVQEAPENTLLINL